MTILVSDRQLRRATGWLRSCGLDGPASALLAARLDARRQAKIGLVAIVGLFILLATGQLGWWSALHSEASPQPAASHLVALIVMLLVAVMTRGLAIRWVTQAERRLGSALTVRAARAPRSSWQTIMGSRRLVMTAVLYAATTAVAVAAFLFGTSTQARDMAVILLTANAAFLLLTCIEIAGIMRRPVLAEDEMSLRADDMLRAADIQSSTTPLLPAMLATLTVSQSGHYPAWLLLCATALCVLVLIEVILSAALPPPVPSPSPTQTSGS